MRFVPSSTKKWGKSEVCVGVLLNQLLRIEQETEETPSLVRIKYISRGNRPRISETFLTNTIENKKINK